jgi:hypothetical protein
VKLLAADSFAPVFEPLLGRRVGYVPSTGGVGDLLVEMAALQLFAHFGVDYHVETLGGDCEADVLVIAGGGPGPLGPPALAPRLAELAESIPVTLLPRSLTAPTGVRLRRCHVRDRASLAWAPDGIVMPDLMLGLEVAAPREAAEDAGVWLRGDEEGLFAGHGLGDPDLVCGTAIDYLALAARHRAIVTDRPELAMAALVQGREATLLPSASSVNRSLFETWLADLGCRWLDARDLGEDGAPLVARVAGPRSAPPPAAHGDPRRVERAVARCDAGLRALETRLAARDRTLEQVVAMFAAGQERLLRRIDDLQESLYALQARPAAHDGAAAAGPADAAAEDRRRYGEVVGRIRGIIRDRLPADAAVLVVSRGDDEILRLFGRRGGHFPQTPTGVYAGHHPADSATAVAHLEDLAAAGWDYLLVPATAFWWFEHYAPFAAHLRRSTAVVHEDADCVVFALREESGWAPLARFIDVFKTREGRFPAILDWATGCGAAGVFPDVPVFAPPEPAKASLPYVEESIDVILVPAGAAARLEEARRVATAAVVEVPAEGGRFVVHPLGRHAAPPAAAARIVPAGRPMLESGGRLP